MAAIYASKNSDVKVEEKPFRHELLGLNEPKRKPAKVTPQMLTEDLSKLMPYAKLHPIVQDHASQLAVDDYI